MRCLGKLAPLPPWLSRSWGEHNGPDMPVHPDTREYSALDPAQRSAKPCSQPATSLGKLIAHELR